jgi:virginiamycin B lyase
VWALGGAGAILLVEVTVLGLLFVGVVTLRQHPHPTPSPVVIPSPVPGVDASRFREYSIPKPGGTPYAIITTPDGSVWFTEAECTSGIGRMTKDGGWDHWPLAPGCGSQPLAITLGPGGNVWYGDLATGFGQVARDGTFTKFTLPQPGAPLGIAPGPDGNMWIAGVSPQGPFVEKVSVEGISLGHYALPVKTGEARGIVAGSDGAMWFTESSGIGRITTAGDITEYPLPAGNGDGSPYQIAAGPDGNLWFVEYLPEGIGRVGRMTTSGQLTEFATPGNRGLQWITAGPDKAMWFTGLISNTIARISLSGSVTTYAVPTYRAQPVGIATGADGRIWFAEDALDGTGRIASFSVK